MKKIFIILALTLVSISANAQEHLKFKNLPIEGNITEFVKKMKVIGYELEETHPNGVIMNGSFAGIGNCTILIITTPKTQTVWKVVVYLPSQISWSSVLSRYNTFKEKYTEKYGKPCDCFEFFLKPYEKGDGYELQAISLEKGHYVTFWQLENGTVDVGISAESNHDGSVKIVYEDKDGGKKKGYEESQIINDDI